MCLNFCILLEHAECGFNLSSMQEYPTEATSVRYKKRSRQDGAAWGVWEAIVNDKPAHRA